MQAISVRKVNQGWIAEVGCQVFVFTDKEKLIEAFGDYLRQPEMAEKKWLDYPSKQPVLRGERERANLVADAQAAEDYGRR